MSFEKYGNKLIRLLSKIENVLEPKSQIGGANGDDGSDRVVEVKEPYVRVISYSVNHMSILVHMDKNKKSASELENPQIEYKRGDTTIKKYTVEQQLRLGCDEEGNMFNFSAVLTHHFKKHEN
jgi:hypothetical protein